MPYDQDKPQSIGLGDRAIPAAPVDTASGGASTAYETEEQEQNIKRKAAAGHVINMDDLGYMGHFAKDSVTAQGHNVGHKPKGVAPESERGGARRGYHVIPGSASAVQGRARFGPPTNEELGLRSRKQREQDKREQERLSRMLEHGPRHDSAPHAVDQAQSLPVMPKPRAISDVKMSIRHHKESIANDMKHAKEHMASAKKHKREMTSQRSRLRRTAK